jgi:Na+/proline symporter
MGWIALLYSFCLIGAAYYFTWRKRSDLETFYNAQRKGRWGWVAFSMVGTATSGLTFLSLPGSVQQDGWTYLQVLAGYLVGYVGVAYILLPLYYQMSGASIYEFFWYRLGSSAEKVAALIFLISRLLASSVRLYLTLLALHAFFPQTAFAALSLLSLLLIYVYAERGGTGTIIYTDVVQTVALLGAALLTISYLSMPATWEAFNIPKIVDTTIGSKHFVWKDFLGGVLIAFTMTGLDQDQMQKSFSMSSLGQAQRMILLYAGLLVPVKLLFLTLGSLMWAYVSVHGLAVPVRSDALYSELAQKVFPLGIGGLFVIGLISATLSSVDGAVIALTTVTLRNLLPAGYETVCFKRGVFWFWLLMSWFVTLYFHAYPPESHALGAFLKLGSYTYGPLLGLFVFALWRRRFSADHRWVVWVVPLSFLITVGTEQACQWDLGYGVILWIAGGTFVGLLVAALVADRVRGT